MATSITASGVIDHKVEASSFESMVPFEIVQKIVKHLIEPLDSLALVDVDQATTELNMISTRRSATLYPLLHVCKRWHAVVKPELYALFIPLTRISADNKSLAFSKHGQLTCKIMLHLDFDEIDESSQDLLAHLWEWCPNVTSVAISVDEYQCDNLLKDYVFTESFARLKHLTKLELELHDFAMSERGLGEFAWPLPQFKLKELLLYSPPASVLKWLRPVLGGVTRLKLMGVISLGDPKLKNGDVDFYPPYNELLAVLHTCAPRLLWLAIMPCRQKVNLESLRARKFTTEPVVTKLSNVLSKATSLKVFVYFGDIDHPTDFKDVAKYITDIKALCNSVETIRWLRPWQMDPVAQVLNEINERGQPKFLQGLREITVSKSRAGGNSDQLERICRDRGINFAMMAEDE
ncbi:hypothetical protein OIO90_004331 [Microbotryomycetes sp. JL221]|nr:hypothetical protein OIO90_004331 [Microbotryomycetes sp. JL221]